ncbi:MAG: GIY-YIG nuclease family protein [Chloroflexi bacterium]|nr:GIY-YIG nuclease family protein [Chloroflexota bacterium]OJW00739.1 MAG: endonuclease [Chloroflexi bacterium 54-19]
MKQYYVYILSSKTRVIYTGVTNDLARRVYQHKNKLIEGFTSRYNITKLVYFEETNDVEAAIGREKQLKNWPRSKKVALINQNNPTWSDLSLNW